MAKVDLETIKAARQLLAAALKEVGEKLGVTFELGASTRERDCSAGSFKLAMREVREDGVKPEQTDFNKVCSLFGLTPADYQKTFQSNGETFTLIALHTKKPKYPVIGKNSAGGQFKFPEDVLKRLS